LNGIVITLTSPKIGLTEWQRARAAERDVRRPSGCGPQVMSPNVAARGDFVDNHRPFGAHMFIFGIVAWMLLILMVGRLLIRRQTRQITTGLKDLAAAFGFDVIEGKDAIRRMGPDREATAKAIDRAPEPLRRMLERATANALCAVGTVDGVQVTIYAYSTGGKNSSTFTVVRGDYREPLPFELRVTSEGGLTRLGKALVGLKDIEIGDEGFDRAVRIKAVNDAGAKEALTRPGTRDAVLALLALPGYASVMNTYAMWEQQGRHFDPEKSRARVAAVVAVARALGER
jgi:hypothetical protein